MVARYIKNNVLYSFYLVNKKSIKLVKTTNAAETVRFITVHDIPGYAIKINKKSVSAANGARGAFCFIADCIKSNFMLVYVDRIIDQFIG